MWSDKETSEDLLGYSAHAKLLENVVTNEKNLPITIGLYGDWGSGKSSILKILQERLESKNDAVVIYFDGWSFENFDDAKMALIQGIIDSLEENKKFFSKVGDALSDEAKALREAFGKLRKSINWMRVLKTTTKSIIPIAAAASTGGASLIIPQLLATFSLHKEELSEILTGEKAEQFLKDAINAEEEEKKYKVVREFRQDFEDLIKKSKKGKVVILIDDLDRCLPRHIIENLEAIKLFLNVPGTAFVIAADKFIVSNAIRSEYKEIIQAAEKNDNNRRDIGESYMEKFIQLPYTIPALSPNEVETYVTLLFCQSLLIQSDYEKVQKDFASFIDTNKLSKYGWDRIQKCLGRSETSELREIVGFVSHFSSIIGHTLKWNPRLIKRFLNAYEIRASLLDQSGVTDSKSKFALLKLMLLEQKYINQFKQLNHWVMNSLDIPQELQDIEKSAEGQNLNNTDYKDWNQKDLLFLLTSEPKFSSVDMKQLFWVSRDNLVDEMSGITLISYRIKSIFSNIYTAKTDKIRETVYNQTMVTLAQDELNDIFDLVDGKLLINAGDKSAYDIYCLCIMHDAANAYNRFISILNRIDISKIPFALANKFNDIINKYGGDKKLVEILSANSRLTNAMK